MKSNIPNDKSSTNSSMTTAEFDGDSKRRKIQSISRAPVKPSRVFSPFRVVGNVSNDTPFAIGTLGSTFYIVTSVGRSFQIYDANTLHLLFVSQSQTETKITSLAAHFHYVYATYGNKIGIYKRGRLEHTLEVDEALQKVIIFGEYLVASSKSSIYVFEKSNGLKVATKFYTKISNNGEEIVDLIHPPTYLNKIVVATPSSVKIFNVHTGKLIYTSPEFVNQITTLESAPVLDIIAIGNVKGEVLLYNLRKGKTIRTLPISEDDSINTISFRTDGSSHVVVGLQNGDLQFYDLDRKARIHILKKAHKESFGGVIKAQFLNGQPIIVTNGGDNQLKEYVFDPSLSTSNSSAIISPPRHLRSRGGHSAPPSSIKFADESSHYLLSGSRDCSFWKFSLRKDAQSQEISQRQAKLKDGNRVGGLGKINEILDISVENLRKGEWDNVLTYQKDETFARTWDSSKNRVGAHQLHTIDNGFVKSISISQCGNFGFVGSSQGGIGVYNLQSGKLRKKYQLHKKAVTGLAIDGMNRKMVSVGLDGLVGFYDFSKSKYLGKLQLNSPITSLVYHRSSDLFAVALDDLSIVVIDSVTQKVVRILYGHTNRITSMDFSPDGRWVVSSSLDSTLRTWDLPTGGCIDGVKLKDVITCVKFSPLGDYLATSHVSQVGISIWTNRAQFNPISNRTVEEDEFRDLELPNVSGENGASIIDGAIDENNKDEDAINYNHYESLDQINSSLITLSLGPRNKFNTLLNLDTIKQRNKPKEPPKKPKNAPFFLQLNAASIGDDALIREKGESKILGNNTDGNEIDEFEASNGLQLKPNGPVGFESEFTKLLREGSNLSDYTNFLKFLSNLSPALTDLEIKSLNISEFPIYVNALTQGFRSNKDVELVEAWMNMLLTNHGDLILQDEDVLRALQSWYEVHSIKSDEFSDLVKYCSGVIHLLTTV